MIGVLDVVFLSRSERCKARDVAKESAVFYSCAEGWVELPAQSVHDAGMDERVSWFLSGGARGYRVAGSVLIVSLGLSTALAQNESFKIDGLDGPREVEFTARVDGSRQRYVEFLPAGYASNRACSLLVFLHGHGSDCWQITRGSQWQEIQAVCEAAARHGLILISPDYRATTSWMGPLAEADLVQILEEQKQRHRLRRILLSGGSMGGTSVLIFTALHPELVHGVISLNGTANMMEFTGFPEAIAASYGGNKEAKADEYARRSPELAPGRFKALPIAFTAGGRDTVVPPQSVLRFSKELARQNPGQVLMLYREAEGHSTSAQDVMAALEFVIERALKP